jgi:hypothetical protein
MAAVLYGGDTLPSPGATFNRNGTEVVPLQAPDDPADAFNHSRPVIPGRHVLFADGCSTPRADVEPLR